MELSSQTTGSEERNYVTLETGSKLSGYTQDYLERLCRLKKVDYRIWNNGQFAIELGSLLQETQTILLNHDGIPFIDKGELADPVPEVVDSIRSSALKQVSTTTAMSKAPTPQLSMSEKIEAQMQSSVLPSPSAPVVVVNEEPSEQVPSMASIIRTPIVAAPFSVPLSSRSMMVNTVVEHNASSLEVPAPISQAPIHIPVSPDSSSVTPMEKESAPVAPPQEQIPRVSLETNSPLPVPVVPIKQSVPFGSLPGASPVKEEPMPQPPAHDNWDAMLFGDAPVSPKVDTPFVPLPPVESVASPSVNYHPIQTSVDPLPHHDDAPLFPILNPNGVTRPMDMNTVISAPLPAAPQPVETVVPPPLTTQAPLLSELYPGRRVVVYAPEDLLSNKVATTNNTPPVAPPPSIPVPEKQGAIYHELLAPVTPASVEKLLPPAPVVPAAIIRKEGAVPSLRVMPSVPVVRQNNLPMNAEEHHLIIEEEHSLVKSVGVNLVFAAVLIGSSFLLLNSTYPELSKKLTDFGSTSYVAGVGAAFTKDVSGVPVIEEEQSEFALPFSDEIIVDPGNKPNSVIVRPVFKTGPGTSYEYALTQVGTSSVMGE